MTNKEINDFKDNVERLIGQRMLGEAFVALRGGAHAVNSWHVIDRISRAEQGYGFLLRYLVDGVDDPSRKKVYSDIIRELYLLRDMIVMEMSSAEMPALYYNTLRSVRSHKDETLESLVGLQHRLIGEMSTFGSLSRGIAPSQSDRLRAEMNERDIFNRLWVTFPFNYDDARAASSLIDDEAMPSSLRALAVSGLTLGLLEFFDERKFNVLLDAYLSQDKRVCVRAVVGIALVLDRYHNLMLSDETAAHLACIMETPSWQSDIRNVFVELIRTSDTKRISERLKQEVFPEIQRMGRDISEKLKDLSGEPALTSDEVNPEWEKLLSDDKIRANLKELTELQEEGADVFMATFSSLKQFPFFNDVPNWFLPYNPEHSALDSLESTVLSTVSSLIASAPYICDSDKYSMALSMSMMPESQRAAMSAQLDAQSREVDGMLAAMGNKGDISDKKSEINNYIHSLYRFYHLFRRKGDFYNPLGHVANPLDISSVAACFDTKESLMALGEFYFKIGLYDYAGRAFERLDGIDEPNALLYQKLGYCCERRDDLDGAAAYYEQADLLDGKSSWNLRRLMEVYRRKGNMASAVAAARRLESILPDDAAVALRLGQLLVNAGDIHAGVEKLRKADFLHPDNVKTLRMLAWALMLDHDFEAAQSLYDRIIADNPSDKDFINAGHLAWASGHLGEAVNFYRLAAETTSADAVADAIRADSDSLAVAGIDTSTIPLVIDAIKYSIK